MSALALNVGLALCGAWLAVGIGNGVHDMRALVRHCTRALVRRYRNRITFHVVGAPYGGLGK